MKIKTLEIAGFASALKALRLPFGKECRSLITAHYSAKPFTMPIDSETDGLMFNTSSEVVVHEKDLQLMQALIKRGDEHGKCVRGINVWVEITAPIYWWNEAVTYRIGSECLSSTSTMHIECKGLQGEELQKAKAEIPMGHEQTRVLMLSYQTLRRIYFQRRNHRLPEWHTFCEWIEGLPFAKELITVEKEAK